MMSADATWSTVATVKVASQAEANVFCTHVKTLHKSYINTVQDNFYTLPQHSNTLLPSDFFMFKTVYASDKMILIALDAQKITLLAKTMTGDDEYFSSEQYTTLDKHGNSVKGAKVLEIIPMNAGDLCVQFFAAVLCEHGLIYLHVSGGDDCSSFTIQQSDPVDQVIGVSFAHGHGLFIAYEKYEGFNKKFYTEISSIPVNAIASEITNAEGFQTKTIASKTFWISLLYLEPTINPKLEAVFHKSQVYVAITNEKSSVSVLGVDYGFSTEKYEASVIKNVPVTHNQFGFYIDQNVVYLAEVNRNKVCIFCNTLLFI